MTIRKFNSTISLIALAVAISLTLISSGFTLNVELALAIAAISLIFVFYSFVERKLNFSENPRHVLVGSMVAEFAASLIGTGIVLANRIFISGEKESLGLLYGLVPLGLAFIGAALVGLLGWIIMRRWVNP